MNQNSFLKDSLLLDVDSSYFFLHHQNVFRDKTNRLMMKLLKMLALKQLAHTDSDHGPNHFNHPSPLNHTHFTLETSHPTYTGHGQRLACHVCSLRGAVRGVSHDFRSKCLSCVAAKKRNVFHTIAFLFFK